MISYMQLSETHSLLNPFDEIYKFRLSKKCKFIEIILKKGDYLFIPRGWYHCVETKEKTIALNYCFILKKNNNKSNNLLSSVEKNKPYKNSCKIIDIEYDDFINKYYTDDNLKSFAIGSNKHISVIKRPYYEVNKFENISLDEALQDEKINSKYIYKGRTYNKDEKRLEILSKTLNFNNILENAEIEDLSRSNSIWFSLNREINSGLHYDIEDNILYVITGEKRILLACPLNNKYLYLTTNLCI